MEVFWDGDQISGHPYGMTTSRIPAICVILLVITLCLSGCIKPPDESSPSGGGDSGSWFGGGSKTKAPTASGTKGTGKATEAPTPTPNLTDRNISVLVPATPFPIDTTPPPTSSFTRLPTNYTVNETPYVAIFYDTIAFKQNRIAYSYQLERPPLIIEMCIKPNMTTRTIWYATDNGDGKTQKVTTVSPTAWFEVSVRDQATGTILAQEGYAKTYSVDTGKRLILRSAGTYLIEFSGNELSAEIQIRVPQTEGQTGQPVKNLSCSI
jgi:hypothetical protein